MGFLLYGRERSHSEFILQKLLVLSKNPPKGKGTLVAVNGAVQAGSDILQKYATINVNTWRLHIVEALAIIKAKKVLRKLGFGWQELQDHYLPHIPELSIHIHPLLKALYNVCERLTIVQASRMVIKINEMHLPQESQQFRFYDYSQLEVFLLFWMTQRIVFIGDQNLEGVNVQILLSYFKLNEMDSAKSILVDTINHNSQHEVPGYVPVAAGNNASVNPVDETNKDSGAIMDSLEMISDELAQLNVGVEEQQQEEIDSTERYVIRREHAGFIVIINQSEFYEDTNPDVKVMPSSSCTQNLGLNID